jgi:predicted ribosome quality control (RQC) complex YloA/Tae2 family protein
MTNFRKHTLSTGKEIYAGKDENTNDELVYQSKPMEILLHTVEPGSPFVNIGENPSKTEMKEAAIFCASRSQHWRDTRKDIPVNWFYKKNTTKNKKDKAGSWHTKQEGKIIAN